MNIFTNWTRGLKTIIAVAAMLLMTHTLSAQQEVDPDHFDGSNVTSQKSTAKVRKTSAHKQPHTTKKAASRKSAGTPAAGK
ncbi:MAG: hypothetical protein ACXVZX_14745 [Terriglobales bacterium]